VILNDKTITGALYKSEENQNKMVMF